MRVHINLETRDRLCSFPMHYNALVQGFLYRHLDSELATTLHDRGPTGGARPFKFFTFSRLMGKYKIVGDQIVFAGPVQLVIASPMIDFLESLARHIVMTGELRLGENRMVLISAEVEFDPLPQRPVILKTLSPITIYSTLLRPEGGKKTYYYSPFEREFSDLVIANLQKKVRDWYGVDIPPDDAYCRPYRVSVHNQHIVKFKDTVIKAWSGLYELSVPPEYFQMAYHAGLGAKNSAGFGCVALYEPKKSNTTNE